MTTFKQVPLTCGGHTRPVVHLDFSDITKDGYFLISACKGKFNNCIALGLPFCLGPHVGGRLSSVFGRIYFEFTRQMFCVRGYSKGLHFLFFFNFQ